MRNTNKLMILLRLIYIASAMVFFLLLFPLDKTTVIPIALVGAFISLLPEKRKISSNKKIRILALVLTVLITIALYSNYLSIYLPTKIELIKQIGEIIDLSYETVIRVIGIFSVLFASVFEFVISAKLLKTLQMIYKNTDRKQLYEAIGYNVKGLPKRLAKSLLIVLACVCIGVLLLLGAFSIPVDPIEKNVQATACYMQPEGMYPKPLSWCTSRLDNSTDAIMFLESADRSEGSLIEKTMLANRGATEPNGSYYTLIDHYVREVPLTHEIQYPRYWHGYLVLLKPLLTVMDFSVIRGVNLVGQTVVALVLVYLLYDNGKRKYILPYIASLLLIMPYIISRSLQFSTCYYLMQLFSIFILLSKDNKKNYLYIFLLAGAATAYFDFLTYPMAVFGLPAVFATIISGEKSTEEKTVDVLVFFVFWALGYLMMWSSKWILASVFTDQNVIADAINSILFRASDTTGIGAQSFNGFDVLTENLGKFFYTPFILVYIALFVYYLLRERKMAYEKRVSGFLPYILLILAPVFWLMLIKNHSMVHAYFTNKSLVVSAFAILSMLVSATESE